jgi:hypothetical protein
MKEKVKILVCGGRDFCDEVAVHSFLNTLAETYEITTLVHGGARGADTLAGNWALKYDVRVKVYKADWAKFGKAAGPIRNNEMLKLECPDIVVAFPGGNGTEHMKKISKYAGVTVINVEIT